jgi:CMP/dCMP kinase
VSSPPPGAPRAPVIAIDGAAGTGKSTVARRLAERLGVPYLDTGAMYRAMALLALEAGVDPDDRAAVASLVDRARIELRLDASGRAEVLLDGEPVENRIRTAQVAAATSRLAVHPEVRERMVRLQRELAGRHGGVIEGRDIGTRVVPDAPFKFFLVADAGVRVDRRLRELRASEAQEIEREEVERDLRERDRRDVERALAPLVRADDAAVVDTSALTAEEVVDALYDMACRGSGSCEPAS